MPNNASSQLMKGLCATGPSVKVAAVPAGLPSRLLEQRPDVRQAETQLAPAAARIGVAKADYFPRVFLTGAIGVGGLVLNGQTFGPQGLFSILPSATVPILKHRAGRRRRGGRPRPCRGRRAAVSADDPDRPPGRFGCARRVPQAPRGPRAAGS